VIRRTISHVSLSARQSTPAARVTWRYRGAFINNGSTLIDDVDMRHYYHVETPVNPV